MLQDRRHPGHFDTGKVESVLQAIASGQLQTSGAATAPKPIEARPFVARVVLDEANFVRRLPAGSTGEAAIFTDHLKATHVVRRVLLRQTAILNYVNPFDAGTRPRRIRWRPGTAFDGYYRAQHSQSS